MRKLDGIGQARRTGNTAVQQTGQIALAHRGVLNITQVLNGPNARAQIEAVLLTSGEAQFGHHPVEGTLSFTQERFADLELDGMPHLGSGITFDWNGRRVLATTNLREGVVSVIDMASWKMVKEIATPGPGFFLRSHDGTPYLWADVFTGENKGQMHIIDKRSLEVVQVLLQQALRALLS